jgi:hypothetical protein
MSQEYQRESQVDGRESAVVRDSVEDPGNQMSAKVQRYFDELIGGFSMDMAYLNETLRSRGIEMERVIEDVSLPVRMDSDPGYVKPEVMHRHLVGKVEELLCEGDTRWPTNVDQERIAVALSSVAHIGAAYIEATGFEDEETRRSFFGYMADIVKGT